MNTTVNVEGLAACRKALDGIADELQHCAETVNHAQSTLTTDAFGNAGAAFVALYHGLLTQHASSIGNLATTVKTMGATVTDAATGYRHTDDDNADALGRANDPAGATTASATATAARPDAATRLAAEEVVSPYPGSSYPGIPFTTLPQGFPSGGGGAFSEPHTLDGAPPTRYEPASAMGSTPARLQLPGELGTVDAPNPRAATAVRAALTQLGVPYQWGGCHPGADLDCSGLTQFAYHQAGVALPHFAASQRVGRCLGTDPAGVLPGDLAVWTGHVAMVIGNGRMIEAGNPVQISPIRTTNVAGGHSETFYGFYRPTESV